MILTHWHCWAQKWHFSELKTKDEELLSSNWTVNCTMSGLSVVIRLMTESFNPMGCEIWYTGKKHSTLLFGLNNWFSTTTKVNSEPRLESWQTFLNTCPVHYTFHRDFFHNTTGPHASIESPPLHHDVNYWTEQTARYSALCARAIWHLRFGKTAGEQLLSRNYA